MKLIKPNFEILTYINGESILLEIEKAARTCYKSEGKIDYTLNASKLPPNNIVLAQSARPLIQKLLNNGHLAMVEFGTDVTVKFICDRGVSHELVRHRVASFAQESTRYCNYNKNENIQFIIPCWFEKMEEITFNGDISSNPGFDPIGIWLKTMSEAEKNYNILIQKGWSPQQARSILPNSLKTEICVKANLREWRHIFELRTANGAHPQMRELMIPLLEEFKKQIPLLFDNINSKL